ncbi:unnamed protein product, partial [Mesorhabditis belari]|uniref:protein-tyrosine-phosphatase n=1 Tax=Mesorhabditis belari TaxID=2138241 RepID=A0AAF3J6P4_9BILA
MQKLPKPPRPHLFLASTFDETAIRGNRPGGFNSFRNHYPELCESSTLEPQTQGVVGGGGMSNSSFIPGACSLSSRVSLSQPCLPHGTDGPTQILPFLYLGSQQDALDQETLKKHNITYVLNLSLTCPKSDILQSDEHFMRIPVNDNYQEKLLPYFVQAFNFLEKVRERGAVVLIHCLAGISRSPTVAISYIMRHKKMGSDEAYRFVKSKRESISPNFNFMGQLLEYERILRDDEKILPQKSDSTAPSFAQKQDFCPAKVPKSCSAMSLFSSLPSSFSTCSSTEESLPPNEHGKRGMGPAQTGNLEKLGSLDGSAIASNLSRPVALGLKSRKPVVIPAPLGEELPSPSSELSKLSFSGGLPHVPSIANPCFITENNVQPMAPSMTSCGSVENPIFGKMVPSIPPKMGTCRSLASNKPFVPQKEIEIHSRSTDFDRSFHSASSPPKSQPMQIPQESKKEIKESPRSRFPLNFFALFRKPDHSSEKIARSQTASAGLSTYASRPDNLAEAGVVREKEAHSPPGTSKTSDLTETNSPESGFQEGYKTSPEDRDPDRTSIGSTSSHEIAVQ